MELDEYQLKARNFAVYPDKGNNITYPALGLGGEAGEVLNQAKKVMRDDEGIIDNVRRLLMVDELGDVLWYVANLAAELGVTLDEVADVNIDKLSKRLAQDQIHGDKRNS